LKYLEFIDQGYIPSTLDESGVQKGEFDKFVWVPRGAIAPKSHPLQSKVWNLLLGVTLDGIIETELHLESTNQINFLVFLESFLNRLRIAETDSHKKYFIILDNVAFHRTQLIKALATKYKIPFLFIPPYTSVLNPVEYIFNYIKSVLNYSETLTWYFKYYDLKLSSK